MLSLSSAYDIGAFRADLEARPVEQVEDLRPGDSYLELGVVPQRVTSKVGALTSRRHLRHNQRLAARRRRD